MTAAEMTPHARAGGSAVGPGPRHGWAVVAAQELRDLWLGTRGLALIFAYSVVLSVLAFLVAGNAELNLLDARESVGLFIRVTLGLGTLATLIIGADAISGERERGTLEHLLLTPVRRRDLVVGKLLAAVSVWIGSLAIAVPYVLVLARGPGIAGDALLALFAAGTLVAVALAAFGVAISSVCRTNRSSLIIAIVILLALAAPQPAALFRHPRRPWRFLDISESGRRRPQACRPGDRRSSDLGQPMEAADFAGHRLGGLHRYGGAQFSQSRSGG